MSVAHGIPRFGGPLTRSLLTWGYATPNLLPGIEKKVNITADLFSAQHRLQLIPMQDAEVYYLRHVPLAQPPHIMMSELIDEVPWRAENIVVWGKTYPQPRLIAWYGDVGKNYTYSGINLHPLPGRRRYWISRAELKRSLVRTSIASCSITTGTTGTAWGYIATTSRSSVNDRSLLR